MGLFGPHQDPGNSPEYYWRTVAYDSCSNLAADAVCTDLSVVAIEIRQSSATPMSPSLQHPHASAADSLVGFMRASGSRTTFIHIRLEADAGGLNFRWTRSVARPQSTGLLHRVRADGSTLSTKEVEEQDCGGEIVG